MSPEEKAAFVARVTAGRAAAAEKRMAAGIPTARKRLHPGPQAAAAGYFPRDAVAAPIPVDVEALVRDAVAKALAGIAAPNAAPSDPDARLRQLTEQLALSIGNLTNQNSGQTLVPPEVLAQRRDAERRMVERIDLAKSRVEQARAAGDPDRAAAEMPLYRLTAKIIAPLMNGDELVEPLRRGSDNIVRPVELDWPLVPNLAMVPVNGPAQEIFALFKELIGNQANVKVVNVVGQGPNAEPAFATDQDRYFLTNQGHAVTTGSATLMTKSSTEPGQPIAGRSGVSIRGDDPRRVNSGPPTMQVRVLGTIAPPAVQNG